MHGSALALELLNGIQELLECLVGVKGPPSGCLGQVLPGGQDRHILGRGLSWMICADV
jgi:hypothetical protein